MSEREMSVKTNHSITISFKGDDLVVYEKICAEAKAERRPIGTQALLLLVRHLDNDGVDKQLVPHTPTR